MNCQWLKCIKEKDQACNRRECRLWIDYKEDHNCIQEAIEKHGPLTLRETAERLGISFVRVKQIEDAAVKRLKRSVIKIF